MRYLLSSFVALVSLIRFEKLDDVETAEWTEKRHFHNLTGHATRLGKREDSGELLAPLTSSTDFSGLVGRREFLSAL